MKTKQGTGSKFASAMWNFAQSLFHAVHKFVCLNCDPVVDLLQAFALVTYCRSPECSITDRKALCRQSKNEF